MIFGKTFKEKNIPKLIKKFAFLPTQHNDGTYIWFQSYWRLIISEGKGMFDLALFYNYTNYDKAQTELDRQSNIR